MTKKSKNQARASHSKYWSSLLRPDEKFSKKRALYFFGSSKKTRSNKVRRRLVFRIRTLDRKRAELDLIRSLLNG